MTLAEITRAQTEEFWMEDWWNPPWVQAHLVNASAGGACQVFYWSGPQTAANTK